MGYYEDAMSPVQRMPMFSATGGDFWRKKEPVIREGKIVTGGMFPAQRTWWDMTNFIKVLVAGYGAGKTNIGCKWIISMALACAPVPVVTVSPTFPVARRTVIHTIMELLAGKQSIYGAQGLWWKYHKTEHEFKIRRNGRTATIWCYSGEDPESLRGPNVGPVLIDEPFIQDEEVFKQMIARVRHPDAPYKQIGMTGTPEQLNWGYQLCVGKYRHQHDVNMVQASTRSNLALDSGYVKRLEGAYTGKAATAFVDGGFVNLAAGIVYYGFDPMPGGNVRDLPIPENAELGVGMDFNVNPFAFVIFWKAGSHMHVFEEFELPNADTEYACSVISDRFSREPYDASGQGGRITKQILRIIYPDATGNARKTSAPGGKTDFTYIRNAGFDIDAPHDNPKVKDRENAVNGKFAPRVGAPTLTISPSCTRLIEALSLYSHEQRNEKAQKAMSHIIDALGYPVNRLFPVDKDTLEIVKYTGA